MAKPGRLPDFRKMYPEASEEVIKVLRETERKMQYQEYDLKAEQIMVDEESGLIRNIPGREDSYERLSEQERQFIDHGQEVEEQVMQKIQYEMLHKALARLPEEEQYFIVQLFFCDRSERELAAELKVSQNAVHKKKQRILKKLKKYFEKN